VNLYRARYEWPSGRQSWVTFAALPHDALRWASDYVRAFVGGELLSITEERTLSTQFKLI
jgi:hypothetical protein